jgi:nitrite reductase (NO-forming)
MAASACVGLGVGAPRVAPDAPVSQAQQVPASRAQPSPTVTGPMEMGNGQAGGHVMSPPTAQGLAHPARDPSVPPIPAGAVKQITFDVTDQKIEVAPDKSLSAWTFDGTVPGPVIHVKQGDTIQFTLNNESKMAHAIDFHAARTAPNVNYKNVNPGQSYTFTWKARDPGVFMYHCGSAPILQHLAEGMYGAVIVDPANAPLPRADREFVFVQSEFYLGATNPDNGITPIDYQKALSGDADVVAFNGYANQYSDHPIAVKVGDKVRVYLVNAGPDHFSAVHVVGTIFDHVYVDGNPKNDLQGVQTYTVAPGEGSVFDFTLYDPGTYPMVSHSFADATKGAGG